MTFNLHDGITDRTVIQILPDTVGHNAIFDCGDGHEPHVYPVMGWASVVHRTSNGIPRVVLEPIVDVEDTYGPIISSDLCHEEGLVLVEVE